MCYVRRRIKRVFIIKNVSSLIKIVNSEIRKVQARFETNHLLLNSNKTLYMIFHRRRHISSVQPYFVVNEIVIKRVLNFTFLGNFVNNHV